MEGESPGELELVSDVPFPPQKKGRYCGCWLTSVYTKDLVIYHDAERQKVKHVCKVMPDVGIAIFPGTLGVEAVGLRHASRLVVASDQMHSVGVS